MRDKVQWRATECGVSGVSNVANDVKFQVRCCDCRLGASEDSEKIVHIFLSQTKHIEFIGADIRMKESFV